MSQSGAPIEPRPTEITSERVPGGRVDLTPRTIARIIDHVLLFFLINVVAWYFAPLWRIGNTLEIRQATFLCVLVALPYLYFVLLEHFVGQTIGKNLVRIRTRGADGEKPSWKEAAVRNSYLLLGLLALVPPLDALGPPLLPLVGAMIIALSVNDDEDTFQGWHDRWAGGTFVVWTEGVKPRPAS